MSPTSSVNPAAYRVGYVVKRYPRYSETFIVNEILAHEAAGLRVDLFALGPSDDTHFQDILARVRAPLTYLRGEGSRASDFWDELGAAAARLPGFYAALAHAHGQPARDVHQAAMLARQVAAAGIDLLHAHFATSAANVARLAAHFAGVPFTFTAHAKDIFHQDVSAADLRAKLAEAAAAVTVSDFNLAHLRDAFGPAADRVRRVYNGLQMERFPYRPAGDRPRRIVGVGRLVEKKGFDDLVRAAAVLKRQDVDFACTIVGHGELEQPLRELIAGLDVGDRVDLAGPRPQAELAALVQSSAVLACPCVVGTDGNRDGLPTVLLEAMALGTPCVATPVTGVPEVVQPGRTGLLVPERDPDALAAALRRILDAPRLGAELAARARELVEERFDSRRTSAELRQVFAAAIEARRAPRPGDGAVAADTGTGTGVGAGGPAEGGAP